jgi:hypothetical protein
MKRLLLLVVGLVALTGCDATMETRIDSGKLERITLTLDEGLSAALRDDPKLDQQLYETFAELAGGPAVRSDDSVISYSAELDDLPDGALTGVADVSVSAGESTITSIDLVVPDRLVSAIAKAMEDEPDAAALTLAWQKSLRITVSIDAPGRIIRVANPDELEIAVDGKVVVSAPLDEWRAGSIQIETAPSSFPVLPVASGLLILLCGGLWLLRR